MKKSLMIVVCLLSIHLQAAEGPFSAIENKHLAACCINGRLLFVIKGDICRSRLAEPASLIVVGKNQQQQLQEPNFSDSSVIGRIECSHENTLYMLPKGSDSKSDDDSYKPFVTEDRKLWQKAEKKKLPIDRCTVWQVIEPRIMYRTLNWDEGKTFGYFPQRHTTEDQHRFVCLDFYGDTAISEAGADLVMCYKKVLKEGLARHKIIALDELSAPVGLPRDKAVSVILSAIIQALMDAPRCCDQLQKQSVLLFTKKRSSFNRYKELIDQYIR